MCLKTKEYSILLDFILGEGLMEKRIKRLYFFCVVSVKVRDYEKNFAWWACGRIPEIIFVLYGAILTKPGQEVTRMIIKTSDQGPEESVKMFPIHVSSIK